VPPICGEYPPYWRVHGKYTRTLNFEIFFLMWQRFETFVVNHYAGSVAYTTDAFCEKNKDLLAVDLVQMMQKSKSKFFAQLFENQATDVAPARPGRKGGGGGGSIAYKSVSATFKTDLASLMDAINAADPHFVRCVNPNSQKQAQLFENQKAVEQLRYHLDFCFLGLRGLRAGAASLVECGRVSCVMHIHMHACVCVCCMYAHTHIHTHACMHECMHR
jgi:hypothetical protein